MSFSSPCPSILRAAGLPWRRSLALQAGLICLAACSANLSAPGKDVPSDEDDDGALPEERQGENPVQAGRCTSEGLVKSRLLRLTDLELKAVLDQSALRTVVRGKDALLFSLQGSHVARVRERVIATSDFSGLKTDLMQAAQRFGAGLPEASPCRQSDQLQACQTNVLRPLLQQLFRRPLQETEWALFSEQHATLMKSHGPREGFEAVVAAAMLSPQTLYLTELGQDPDADVFRLTNAEALQHASFALVGKPPTADVEAELLGLSANEFKSALAGHAAKWAQTPEFAERAADSLEAHLGMSHLAEVERDDKAFDHELKQSMRAEFRAFLQDNLFAEDGAFSRLFTQSESRKFPGLEKVYGAKAVAGDRMKWDANTRKGLLGLSGILAAHSSPTGSDPVQRGILVRLKLLCEPMPPPVADADFSKVVTTPQMQTRERFETLAQAAQCRSCHQVINPPGYLFEHFDHLGRYRSEEKGRAINASGEISSFFGADAYEGAKPWQGLVPLAEWMAESKPARQCMSVRLLDYVLADEAPEGMANCAAKDLSKRFAESGKLVDLVADLVQSDLFLYRTRSL